MGRHEMPDDVRAAIEDDGIDPETGELLDQTPPDDDEPEPDLSDPENAPEPQPQPEALTPEKADAIFASLDRYKAVVAREVERRAGVLFDDLMPCPVCMDGGNAPGFFLPNLPEPDQTMRRMAVSMVLGGDGQPEYPEDPETETCERCAGYGQTRTGSHAPGQETRACPGCSGMGWKQKTAPVQTYTPPQPLQNPPPVFPQAPQPFAPQPFGNGGGDTWGRPVGHPHYGQNPALIGV